MSTKLQLPSFPPDSSRRLPLLHQTTTASSPNPHSSTHTHTHTSWFWPSWSVQSHWTPAAAPQPGWRSPPLEEGGSWRTGTAATAASAGQSGAWGPLCSRLMKMTMTFLQRGTVKSQITSCALVDEGMHVQPIYRSQTSGLIQAQNLNLSSK